jgi:hypothetical protein
VVGQPSHLRKLGLHALFECVSDLNQAAAEQLFKLKEHEVLQREIDWQSYAQSKFLTEKELGLMLDYDKQPAEDQDSMLSEVIDDVDPVRCWCLVCPLLVCDVL